MESILHDELCSQNKSREIIEEFRKSALFLKSALFRNMLQNDDFHIHIGYSKRNNPTN